MKLRRQGEKLCLWKINDNSKKKRDVKLIFTMAINTATTSRTPHHKLL